MADCFCGSGQTYKNCCEPYINGVVLPASAELLMRSRYSAFCVGNAEYLMATLHPDRHRTESIKALRNSFVDTHWHSLRILSCDKGLAGDTGGEVEFTAFYSNNQQIVQLHERSRFLSINSIWYYLDGDMLPAISLGRNDSCWCGSSKKSKKCHPN
ncbi:MAG: SEC-C motif-containing protein [Zhongshania sp.]|jgi:SEC-C motif-containing protein